MRPETNTITGHRTLGRVLEHRAQSAATRTFLIFDDFQGPVSRFTYGEFDALACSRTSSSSNNFP